MPVRGPQFLKRSSTQIHFGWKYEGKWPPYISTPASMNKLSWNESVLMNGAWHETERPPHLTIYHQIILPKTLKSWNWSQKYWSFQLVPILRSRSCWIDMISRLNGSMLERVWPWETPRSWIILNLGCWSLWIILEVSRSIVSSMELVQDFSTGPPSLR